MLSSMHSFVTIKNNILYSNITEDIYPNENMVKLMFEKFDQMPEREILVNLFFLNPELN